MYVEQAWFSLMHALLESLRAEIPSVKLNFCETIFSPQNDGLGPRFVSGDKKREISMLGTKMSVEGGPKIDVFTYIFNAARAFQIQQTNAIYLHNHQYLFDQASYPSQSG